MTFTRTQEVPAAVHHWPRDQSPGALVARTRRLFPERMRIERARKNMSQLDVAKAIYVGQTTISNWEKGRFQPKMVDIVILAELFSCSTDYLLGRHIDP